jgi:hypothetical protein
MGVMVISDADSGRVVATVPIGSGTDGAAFDPATKLAFSSNGEGTLTVVHEESARQLRRRPPRSQRSAVGAPSLWTSAPHRVYTVAADFGRLPSRPRIGRGRGRRLSGIGRVAGTGPLVTGPKRSSCSCRDSIRTAAVLATSRPR